MDFPFETTFPSHRRSSPLCLWPVLPTRPKIQTHPQRPRKWEGWKRTSKVAKNIFSRLRAGSKLTNLVVTKPLVQQLLFVFNGCMLSCFLKGFGLIGLHLTAYHSSPVKRRRMMRHIAIQLVWIAGIGIKTMQTYPKQRSDLNDGHGPTNDGHDPPVGHHWAPRLGPSTCLSIANPLSSEDVIQMETFISKISLLQPPSWKSRKYGVNIIYILETLLYLFGGYYILHMYIYIYTQHLLN